MPEAERRSLHHRFDLDQRGRPADLLEHGLLAAGLQRAFKHEVLDEVGDDAVLALGGDDDQPLGAGFRSLGGDQFDTRGVDNRQQLFRDRLGRGQEAGAQTRGGHDRGPRDRYLWPCHH